MRIDYDLIDLLRETLARMANGPNENWLIMNTKSLYKQRSLKVENLRSAAFGFDGINVIDFIGLASPDIDRTFPYKYQEAGASNISNILTQMSRQEIT